MVVVRTHGGRALRIVVGITVIASILLAGGAVAALSEEGTGNDHSVQKTSGGHADSYGAIPGAPWSVKGSSDAKTFPPVSGPVLIPSNTTYEPLSGGIANEVTPNFTLNVGIIDTGTGINTANVIADVSSVSTLGTVLMDLNGSYAGVGQITYFNKTVKVDKVVRGIFNVTVTAYDTSGVSGTTNLIVIAFMYPGVKVIGYNSSKNVPAHPSNASMFYNNSPVEIIVNTIDKIHYSSVTANFFEADGSIPLESNNSGVLLPDGNYSYRITHTLGIIPTQDARIVWINVTMSTPYGPVTIPKIGALVVVSNINPREHFNTDLGGSTTNFRDIPDYSAAYLVFEPYNGSNRIATLKFNEPINLTDYTTSMNLKNLGEMLKMSGKSMNLNATADALREFNKAATLSIYNLTAFTVSPAILQDGVLIVPSEKTSGGAVVNLSWDNSTHTLSFDVSHWTEYSWDGEPPTVYPGAVGYPAGQTTVRSGQSITLSAAIMDLFSGVKNATVNAASIGAGTVVLNNVSGNWMNSSVAVNASDGTYNLNISAYDKAGNLNNTAQIRVIVVNTLTLPALVSSITPNSRNAQVGTPVTIFMSVINGGTATATGVSVAQASGLPVTISYQQWNGTAFTGSSNTPVDIAAGGTANFVLTINATAAFSSSPMTFNVSGTNAAQAPISGVNTLTISASIMPSADVIMMSTSLAVSTAVNTPAVFAVATANVGGANATGVSLVLSVPTSITGLVTQVNQTNPTTGAIIGPATGLTINAGAQPTFAVFLTPTVAIANDPANNRITLQLVDGSGKIIGAQSVAVSTT
ncbi:MAG: hypothetical protein ABOK23_01155 [Candidatus Methanoperedens sp.]|nr:hypothetical protein [Candidatus Methanoperedens sp.]